MASVLTTGCLEELIYVNCDVVQLSRLNTTYFLNCRTGGNAFFVNFEQMFVQQGSFT